MQHSGFPRREGSCFVHDISEEDFPIYNQGDDIPEEILSKALQFLRGRNADLIYGDLIFFETGLNSSYSSNVAIFDGSKIINITDEYDEYGSIPPQFHVIENGVPIDYWCKNYNNIISLDSNPIVWFDHSSVRNECLQNVKTKVVVDSLGCEDQIIYTTFHYEGKEFMIVFDYSFMECDLDPKIIEKEFRNCLQRNHLVFSYNEDKLVHENPYLMIESWRYVSE